MIQIFSLPKRIIDFLGSVIQELKYVEWLSRKETLRYSMIVLGTTIFFGILLASLDKIFSTLISKLLDYFV